VTLDTHFSPLLEREGVLTRGPTRSGLNAFRAAFAAFGGRAAALQVLRTRSIEQRRFDDAQTLFRRSLDVRFAGQASAPQTL
jgi:hypothetical protein